MADKKQTVLITATCSAKGKALLRGKTVSLSAADARALVGSGRARYTEAPVKKLTAKNAPTA